MLCENTATLKDINQSNKGNYNYKNFKNVIYVIKPELSLGMAQFLEDYTIHCGTNYSSFDYSPVFIIWAATTVFLKSKSRTVS